MELSYLFLNKMEQLNKLSKRLGFQEALEKKRG